MVETITAWLAANWPWLLTVALPAALSVYKAWVAGKRKEALFILADAMETAAHMPPDDVKADPKFIVRTRLINPHESSGRAAREIVNMAGDVDPKNKDINKIMRDLFIKRKINK